MRSKIEIELRANGVLGDITQGLDKIFQGAVGVTEYYLTVDDGLTGDYNWRQTDVVYMVMKRNDGTTAQVKMTPDGTGWTWTSNGWETDVDISGATGTLEVSFVAKRYSTVSLGTIASEKTTQKINLLVYASAGYVPQNLELETAELLEAEINTLQLDKVGRYSVSAENLPYLPADIVYAVDGAKSPNNIYYDFTHDVLVEGVAVEKTGYIFVSVTDSVQLEEFVCNDETQYTRRYVNSVMEDFVSAVQQLMGDFTYDKETIDGKDATTLQSAKDYADDNFYDETEADGRFVHLTGNESINGTKTFVASPITPDPTANTHVVNRQSMYNYTYSKTEVNNLTTPISFDLMSEFTNWLAGTYVRTDGLLPSDLLVGKKVIIKEAGQNNYQVAEVPVVDITDFKILVEDNKTLAEIGATAYKDITANDGQEFVEVLKDQIDKKDQAAELDDLTVAVLDWTDNTTNYYYDHYDTNYTDPTMQRLELFSNDITQNTLLVSEGIVVLAVENVTDGTNFGARIYINKLPSVALTFKVLLHNYTDTIIPAGEILAENIGYDNATSGLTATDTQAAVDELASEKIDKTLSIITTTPQYAVMLQTNGNPKYMQNASIGQVLMAGQMPKNAIFDSYGKLGSLATPTETTDYVNLQHLDSRVPTVPTNQDTKFLGWDGLGNAIWKTVVVGTSGYKANLYMSELDSDVSGYKKISYVVDPTETEETVTVTNQEALAETFLYDDAVGVETLDAGDWLASIYCKASPTVGTTWYRVVGFLRHTDTTETTIFDLTSSDINNTAYAYLSAEYIAGSISCATTDRVGFRLYIGTTHNAAVTVNYKKGDGYASYFNTPIALRHNQLRGLNEDDNFLHVTKAEKDEIFGETLWEDETGSSSVDLSGKSLASGDILEIEYERKNLEANYYFKFKINSANLGTGTVDFYDNSIAWSPTATSGTKSFLFYSHSYVLSLNAALTLTATGRRDTITYYSADYPQMAYITDTLKIYKVRRLKA